MIGERRLEAVAVDRASVFEAMAVTQLQGSYRLAGLILRDPVEAEDATHDAYVIAWRQWPTLRDPGRFDAWFGRILVNVCRDRLRARGRRRVVDISATIGRLGTPDVAAAVVDRDEIERAFVGLTPDQRIVVVLRFYLDLSVDQIAERVGVPAGTVKSRLHHAIRRLGVGLDPHAAEDES
jgi:RNA polymerase sigma-70 factor, ECF subfamily